MIDYLNPVKRRNYDWGTVFTFELECLRLYVPNGVAMRMHGQSNTFYGIEFLDMDISIEANDTLFNSLGTLIDSKASFKGKLRKAEGKSCYVGKIANVMRKVVICELNKMGYNDVGFINPSNVVLGSLIIGRTVKDSLSPELKHKNVPILEYEKTNPQLFRRL